MSRLSELLGVPIPTLPSLGSTAIGSVVSAGTSSFVASEEVGGPGSLWIDEEDKNFYEDLRDLRGEVPASFLGVTTKEDAAQPSAEEKTAEDDRQDDAVRDATGVDEDAKEEPQESVCVRKSSSDLS